MCDTTAAVCSVPSHRAVLCCPGLAGGARCDHAAAALDDRRGRDIGLVRTGMVEARLVVRRERCSQRLPHVQPRLRLPSRCSVSAASPNACVPGGRYADGWWWSSRNAGGPRRAEGRRRQRCGGCECEGRCCNSGSGKHSTASACLQNGGSRATCAHPKHVIRCGHGLLAWSLVPSPARSAGLHHCHPRPAIASAIDHHAAQRASSAPA